MNRNIIVALDVKTDVRAMEIVDTLGEAIDFYKIGSVLFTHYGPDLIRKVKDKGKRVFLDLKYHDIPNTVASAVSEAVKLNVDMITLHTLGGFTMLKEAQKAALEVSAELGNKPPILLGVTVLTSMKEGDLAEVGINRKVKSEVKKLAVMARNAGIAGSVCSSKEIEIIKRACGKDFIVVVPGIRPESSDKGDQKRVATPQEALDRGADFLVIGRPIIEAQDPKKVVQEIITSCEK